MANNNPNLENLKPFQKGHKGMGGRPKGSKDLTVILEKLLNKEIEVANSEGEIVRKKPKELIAMALINQAAKGDVKAIAQIFDRIEGKATQPIDAEFTFISHEDALDELE